MLAVCRRYARTDLEAEDILQEGFIKVFDNVSKFRGNGSFEGWIRRIMVNTALKLYRKNSFKNEVIGIDEGYDMPQDATILEKLSQGELMKMVQGLPEGYQVVFNLYAIEGFSHAEIADTLGVNEGTSRSQLAKARKWLQKKVIESQNIEYERK
ncbi:MAG: RNA polymerase sigma factor [Bacteroidota bacterium]|nr:RNA polymerase sigma factor [Bacteroidota bacterium]